MVFVLRDLVENFGTVVAEAVDDIVDVLDGEHDAAYAQRVRRCVFRLGPNRGRGVEPGQLDAAVAVWRSHHGDVGADVVESDDLAGPGSLDGRPAFDLHAELSEECLGGLEVFDVDEDVVHSSEHHGFLSFESRITGISRAVRAR